MMNEYEMETQEMARMYHADKSLREVGKHFGLSGQGIAYRLRRAGVETRPRGKRDWSQDLETLAMYKLYSAGKTLKEVGRLFEMSDSGVGHRFHAAGFKVRARGSRPAVHTVDMAFKLSPALFDKLCQLSEAHTGGNRSELMRILIDGAVEAKTWDIRKGEEQA